MSSVDSHQLRYKAYYAERDASRYEQCKAAGVCVTCHVRPRGSTLRCPRCQARVPRRAYQRKGYPKQWSNLRRLLDDMKWGRC